MRSYKLEVGIKGGRHLPYLEKNIDSLGIVTPVHQRSKSWLLAPSRNIGILHRPGVILRAFGRAILDTALFFQNHNKSFK